LLWLRSTLLRRLGVAHGFSTRIGGVSQPPYRSLSFGVPADGPPDLPERLAQNERRFMRAIGAADLRRVSVHQVHGQRALTCGPDTLSRFSLTREDPRPQTKADAMLTDEPGLLLSVKVADCAGLLLASADGRAVAAVHAGWRGVIGGVVGSTIQRMQADLGVRAEDLVAAIGPCIGPEAFEVGPEVVEAFAQAGLHAAVIPAAPPRKARVDLVAAIIERLLRAGVSPEAVDRGAGCTYQHPDRFFSHRRDRGITGRMIAAIASSLSTSR
jgi:YfiH family protein